MFGKLIYNSKLIRTEADKTEYSAVKVLLVKLAVHISLVDHEGLIDKATYLKRIRRAIKLVLKDLEPKIVIDL